MCRTVVEVEIGGSKENFAEAVRIGDVGFGGLGGERVRRHCIISWRYWRKDHVGVRSPSEVVAVDIERSLDDLGVKILDGLIPIGFIGKGMVKDLGIPFVTTSEDDVRELTEFLLSVRLHLEVRKAIDDVKGNDVTVVSDDALSSTNTHGAVVNFVAVGLNLTRRVYRAVQTMVGVLARIRMTGPRLVTVRAEASTSLRALSS